MKRPRVIFVTASLIALASIATLLIPAPSANAKGKPGGGGGEDTNAAFVFESFGKGLFLTTIDDGNRVQLTFARNKANHEEPVWSPDLDPETPGFQGMIAYTELVEAYTGPRHLYVINPNGTGNRQVRANVSGVELAWTPNGKEIVMADGDVRIVAVDVATGNQRVLLENRDTHTQPLIGGITLSSLGMIAFHEYSDIVVGTYWLDESGRIQVDMESLVTLVEEPLVSLQSPSFSPDGTFLAYSRNDPVDSWQIIVLDLLTGEDMLVIDGLSGGRRVAWSPDGSQLATHIRTFSARGNSMDLFRITGWDDPAKRRVIPVTQTDGSKDVEVSPAWKPDWMEN